MAMIAMSQNIQTSAQVLLSHINLIGDNIVLH